MNRLIASLICLLINLFLILFVSDACRAQVIEAEIVWPGSLHSDHTNQCNPHCAKQDNGGVGFLLTAKGTDKFYNLGFGVIEFTNSFGDPGHVDILQLAEAEAELGFLRVGAAVWKMWIFGYYKDKKPIVHNTPPWPVFHASVNPLYYWTDNFWITGRYIDFVGVSLTFVTVGYKKTF